MKGIKNIIFDLGGVLIHLDTKRTEAAFGLLMGAEAEDSESVKALKNSSIFEDLEVNAISEDSFMEAIQKCNPKSISKEEIEKAWNAMLLTIPLQGLNLIEELRTLGYRLYILSNTNSIHIRAFRKILEKEHGLSDFDALFDKTYYSHLVELRKPHAAVFQHVLDDAGLKGEESLFIDDNEPNLVGARKVGIQTLLLEANGDVYTALKKKLNLL